MRLGCFAFAALWLGLARSAHAGDPIAAEATFAEGRALMKEGRYAEACARFETSLAIERAVGTEVNLAECYAHLGRSASSWLHYREAAALAQQLGQSARAAEARDRAAKLEPRLCRLTLLVRAQAPPTMTVRRDGHLVERTTWGIAVPVDPGEHTLEMSAHPGETIRRTIVVAAPTEGQPCAETRVELPIPRGPTQARPSPKTAAPAGRRIAAAVTAGAGVTALGVGAIFAGHAIATKGGAECTPAGCTEAGRSAINEAGRSADIATGFAIAGATLIAAGAVAWLTSPAPRSAAPRLAFLF